jgi:tetratricopeptide (TPR) repeat protein
VGEKAWQSCAPQTVAVAALTALQINPASAAQLERVERWLQQTKTKDAKTQEMLMVCLAALRDFQGRHAEAIDLYRQVLSQNSNNPMALNNLAWLLALKDGKHDEALELVDKVIKTMGPNPSLLDTRAVIYLKMRRTDQAIQDLEEAVATLPTPANCFHLAEAYQTGKRAPDPKAQKAFEDGLNVGLKAERLHSLEREDFHRLRQLLQTETKGNRFSSAPAAGETGFVSKP